jgi:hypothetical protein
MKMTESRRSRYTGTAAVLCVVVIFAGCAAPDERTTDQPVQQMQTTASNRLQVDAPDSVECFKKLADEDQDAQDAKNKGDFGKALTIWHTSARRGNLFSKLSLCLFHNSSVIPDELRNMDEAYEQCVDLGKKGYATAQYMLGRIYLSGRGVEKSIAKAKPWFELAADGGNGESQYLLALFYLTGKYAAKDIVMAYKWINLAAQQNISDSTKVRDNVESLLTRPELTEAQRLTRTWSERKGLPWMPEEIPAACPKS